VFDPLASAVIKLGKGENISEELMERINRRIPIVGPLIEPWLGIVDEKTKQEGRDF
jgi:hypothetical protein